MNLEIESIVILSKEVSRESDDFINQISDGAGMTYEKFYTK